jgi:dTDP-4-dehydrorhamnose reductase
VVLIVGGESTIGAALANYYTENNIPFHASTRNVELVSDEQPYIDLAQPQTFRGISGYKSAVVCAAVTDMGTCEKTPDSTRAVNIMATIKLIKYLINKNIHIVFLSTNQVFDGKKPMHKPDALRNPINEYGKQKAEVERFVENSSNAAILRLTKVIYPGLELLNKWMNSLSNGISIFAFTDMTLSPINIEEVVQKIDSLVSRKATGIYQLSGESDISYYDFAQKFARENGYSPNLVIKDTWKGKLEFEPPKFTSMVNV